MLLTVPDAGLADLLASQSLLLQTWHDAARDVMMLIHILRTAMPTLADVLAVGLIVLTSPAASSVVILRHRRAALTAVARGADGVEVIEARQRPREVLRLDVCGVHVDAPVGLALAAP